MLASRAMSAFVASYPEARARFLEAVGAFEAATGRRCDRARHTVADGGDFTVDVAHFEPREGRRLFLVTSGVHGIEGYAGNAIQRALLAGPLARVGGDCGIMLVHAVNPWGMAHFQRVNPNNVDLNRNFVAAGDALYRTPNPGYRLIAGALAPGEPCRGALASQARLLADLAGAVLAHGYASLKQALLAGQYDLPDGLFHGGTGPQPETRVFTELFEPLCSRYGEILLTDLHTGYGHRAQVLPIFLQADSRDIFEDDERWAPGADGREQGFVVTGDLVAWCRLTAKRVNPKLTFNGIVIELGTTGLSVWSQLRDLGTMVRENQVHRCGARTPAIERAVRESFRELFFPRDPAWQRDSLAAAIETIGELLARRGFFAA
jgi:hypothetical protein